MEKTSTSKSRERAQQLYDKKIELEKKRQKALQARIPPDANTWQQIREIYEAIILEDHGFSEQHNIELSLWQLHYKRIEEFRAHCSAAQASARSSTTSSARAPVQPDRITKIRMNFKAFLSEATGFYHDLILKIRSKYGLPLGHLSDDADNLAVLGTDTAKSSDVKKALGSCHRCLIYLGDLARYKGLYGEGESRTREYSAASSYYLQAASLLPSNGNSHHQLAILATYSSDELLAIYRYFRSLAAEVPFPTAKDNLVIAFEKNRQSYTKLIDMMKAAGSREVGVKEKYTEFSIQFVRLHGILFSRTSLETFSGVLSSVSGVLCELLSSGSEEEQKFGGDSMENGLVILRLTATLIFTVYYVNRRNESQTYAEILQHNVVFENACTVTFELMGLIVERCLQLRDPSSSFLLPGILVFLEWLACSPDVAVCTSDEKKTTAAKMSFWKPCIALLNKLLSSHKVSVDDDGDETCFTNMSRYEEGENESRFTLWEDFELRGFLPLLAAQSILNFSRKHSVGAVGSNKEKRTRVKRIFAAGKALVCVAMVDQKAVSFDSNVKQFIIGTQPQVSESGLSGSNYVPPVSRATEQELAISSVNSNIQLLLEGEDEDEEIVFKPLFVEKQMDALGLTQSSSKAPEQGMTAPPLTSVRFQQTTSELIMPSSDNIAVQPLPLRHLRNSTRLTEQQASVADGIQKSRFVNNGLALTSEMKGTLGLPSASSLFPPQPSVGVLDTASYNDYMRVSEVFIPPKLDFSAFPGIAAENMAVKPPPLSASCRSQGGRPVRHLGPPPGFSAVPPKAVNMPLSTMVAANGSMVVDDYSWLDGYRMLSSTSSVGPNHMPNQVSLTNTHIISNSSSSNGNGGLPFPGMQSSGVQLQGGNLKNSVGYQSFQNIHPNNGQKLLEQQHIMAGNQLTFQAEHYQGQPTWNGHYRV